ncbi:hypothetical protein MRB53_003883 [Persea americana]|uniref:Uncharacterized protein n=1 Tax=Persea americana TaxID=3435 RepID=A0ACC2MYN7_PERAE|nr:hypothetical protein MRB53_003883 [Persea americana]
MNTQPEQVCYQPPKMYTVGVWLGDNPLNYSLPLLTLQLFLVFTTTRFFCYILRPLKQPRVVSEILGGIVLGPSFLGRSETFSRIVFPPGGTVVLNTVGMFGLMYCVFLIGVKMDPGLIRKSGRKALLIGMAGVISPLTLVAFISLSLGKFLLKEPQNVLMLSFLAALLPITSFAVLIPILCELRLLNSDLGRLAMSTSILSDIWGWFLMVLFIVLQASSSSPAKSAWALFSAVALVSFIVFVIRPMTLWIISQTPKGRPVAEIYILFILVLVLVIGFFGDMIGANSFNGALVLGLAIPDGPPLGDALVDKLDCIISGLLLPLYYAVSGLKTDVFAIHDLNTWTFLQIIFITSCLGKLLGTLLPSLYYKMPFRDAFSLSLLMNSKGLVEVITFNLWKDLKLLDDQSFAILVLSTVMTTAAVTPLMRFFYEPSKKYVVHGRRTIEHSRPETEITILTCVHTQSNVPSLIKILEASHPTPESPILIYPIHLIQLVGRSIPLIVPHDLSRPSFKTRGTNQSEPIINAFRIFQERHEDVVSVHPFTSIAPSATMHEDVLTLALHKKVTFMIIPFHKQPLVGGGMEHSNAIETMNINIISNAPCSVGILIDHAVEGNMYTQSGQLLYRIGVFFFGGDDDREALAYAGRMAMHPCVNITIVRFFAPDSIKDQSKARRLDEEAISYFKAKNMRNNRVSYGESMVKDSEQIVKAIRSITSENYDLLMVGMRHERCALLSTELTGWSECPELGVIGDLLASKDLSSTALVLVIRQQAHVRSKPKQEQAPFYNIIQPYGASNSGYEAQGDDASIRSSTRSYKY